MASGSAEFYRVQAAQCVIAANKAGQSEIKTVLLDMAAKWLALADQAERNSKVELVYETPEPRQDVAQQQQQPQLDDEKE